MNPILYMASACQKNMSVQLSIYHVVLVIVIAFVSRIDTAPSSIGTVYTKCAHLVYVYQWIWNWELFLRKVYVFPPATLALLQCALNYARC